MHLLHREEDRAQAVRFLERQCEVLTFYTDETHAANSRIDAEACRDRLTMAGAAILRLQNIPAEQLLYDRALTAINETDYVLPLSE